MAKFGTIEKRALIQEFVDQRMSAELPDIRAVNATAAAEIEAIHAQQFPELARGRSAARPSRRRTGRSRESLHPESFRLDSRVISSAFVWLDLRSARASERQKWLGFVRNFLELTLGSIPRIDDPDHQKIDGLPDHFDDWVFAVVAGAIPLLTASEDPRSLCSRSSILAHPPTSGLKGSFGNGSRTDCAQHDLRRSSCGHGPI
jgi:hypothetical protein